MSCRIDKKEQGEEIGEGGGSGLEGGGGGGGGGWWARGTAWGVEASMVVRSQWTRARAPPTEGLGRDRERREDERNERGSSAGASCGTLLVASAMGLRLREVPSIRLPPAPKKGGYVTAKTIACGLDNKLVMLRGNVLELFLLRCRIISTYCGT